MLYAVLSTHEYCEACYMLQHVQLHLCVCVCVHANMYVYEVYTYIPS